MRLYKIDCVCKQLGLRFAVALVLVIREAVASSEMVVFTCLNFGGLSVIVYLKQLPRKEI